MKSQALADAFNQQLTRETSSAYLYQQMTVWCSEQGLAGFAHWVKMQVLEERLHADKFFDYLLDRDVAVHLEAIQAPEKSWSSVSDLFASILEHERMITDAIHSLMELAGKEGDHAAKTFLQWFITEQVEEEANVRDIRDKLKLADGFGPALLMLDADMATRPVPTPPPAG
ncbi:MAG: ferritin [Planctomycetota bacterium]|jgi:ferritin|nr:ferritin [Planctomycetota bacterium]